MIIRLGELQIEFVTQSAALVAYLAHIFAGTIVEGESADIILTAKLCTSLPPFPTQPPFYQDRDDILAAYAVQNGTLLHFLDGGTVFVPASGNQIELTLTANGITSGAIEDMLMVGLAPLLRRRGYFLLHASGVSKHGKGLIFIGQSHSGKTTTALNLALHGWKLLSNDVVLIRADAGQILAYPVPDVLTIRPKTLQLLPQIPSEKVGAQFVPDIPVADNIMAASQLVEGWSPAVPIGALCFSQIGNRPKTLIKTLRRAMALSIILEESADVWDSETLTQQTNLLTELCLTVPCYRVALGTDLSDHSTQFERLLTTLP